MNYSDLTVIIPTLNEEGNIGRLVGLLKRLYKNARIMVVDDGSKDKTQEVAKKKGVFVLDRSKEKIKGLTASVINGIKKTKTGYFVVMDSDFQHPPEKIAEIARNLQTNDVVIGARDEFPEEWGAIRKIISFTAGMLGRLRLSKKGFKVKDVVSGFFGAKTSLVTPVLRKYGDKFEKKGYKILFDLLKYLPNDARIKEIKYKFNLRKIGASKISINHIWIYLKSLFR